MAGETSLPTQYYHDDQQLCCEVVSALTTAGVPVLYADRNLIIDSVVIGSIVAAGAGVTATIRKTTAGTNDGVTITPAAPNAALTSVMATGTIPLDTIASTIVVSTESATRSLSIDHNTLDAGNWLFFVPSAAASGYVGAIQIRFRSRPK